MTSPNVTHPAASPVAVDTNYFGITYDSNVTYWYRDGAVNWHRTVDGGEFNLTHTNTSGTVPAAPGSTATIPGTDSGRRGGDGSPIIVTVCNQEGAAENRRTS